MAKTPLLIFDLDCVKYAAAAVGERRTILVTHKATGREMEFSNRTEFYGRNKKGGWLGDRNEGRDSPFEIEDFAITDLQQAEPIENALHTAKLTVQRALEYAGTKRYKGFIGKGDSFRVERSSVLKYKGQRADLLKPIHLDAVSEYLETKFEAEIVTHLEADDRCVIECVGTDNILAGIDKDFYGCPVNFLNIDRERKPVDCNMFGSLFLDPKGKVRGYGRMFFYFQVASGDTSDNYKANSASLIKWADKGAYNALKDCKDDKEAMEALVKVYKMLYPKPVVVMGWRGEPIEVDWLYMLQENYTMARMLEREDEPEIMVVDRLKELGCAGSI